MIQRLLRYHSISIALSRRNYQPLGIFHKLNLDKTAAAIVDLLHQEIEKTTTTPLPTTQPTITTITTTTTTTLQEQPTNTLASINNNNNNNEPFEKKFLIETWTSPETEEDRWFPILRILETFQSNETQSQAEKILLDCIQRRFDFNQKMHYTIYIPFIRQISRFPYLWEKEIITINQQEQILLGILHFEKEISMISIQSLWSFVHSINRLLIERFPTSRSEAVYRKILLRIVEEFHLINEELDRKEEAARLWRLMYQLHSRRFEKKMFNEQQIRNLVNAVHIKHCSPVFLNSLYYLANMGFRYEIDIPKESWNQKIQVFLRQVDPYRSDPFGNVIKIFLKLNYTWKDFPKNLQNFIHDYSEVLLRRMERKELKRESFPQLVQLIKAGKQYYVPGFDEAFWEYIENSIPVVHVHTHWIVRELVKEHIIWDDLSSNVQTSLFALFQKKLLNQSMMRLSLKDFTYYLRAFRNLQYNWEEEGKEKENQKLKDSMLSYLKNYKIVDEEDDPEIMDTLSVVLADLGALSITWNDLSPTLQDFIIYMNKKQFGKLSSDHYILLDRFAIMQLDSTQLSRIVEILFKHYPTFFPSVLPVLANRTAWKQLTRDCKNTILEVIQKQLVVEEGKLILPLNYIHTVTSLTLMTFDIAKDHENHPATQQQENILDFLLLHQPLVVLYFSSIQSMKLSPKQQKIMQFYFEWLRTLPSSFTQLLLQVTKQSEIPQIRLADELPDTEEVVIERIAKFTNDLESYLNENHHVADVASSQAVSDSSSLSARRNAFEVVPSYNSFAFIKPASLLSSSVSRTAAVKFQGQVIALLEYVPRKLEHQTPRHDLLRSYFYSYYLPDVQVIRFQEDDVRNDEKRAELIQKTYQSLLQGRN